MKILIVFLLALCAYALQSQSKASLTVESISLVGDSYPDSFFGPSPMFSVALPYERFDPSTNTTVDEVAMLVDGNHTLRGSIDGGRTFGDVPVVGEPHVLGTLPHAAMPKSVLPSAAVTTFSDTASNSKTPRTMVVTPDRWLYQYHPENKTFTTSKLKNATDSEMDHTYWLGFPYPTFSFRIVSGGIVPVPGNFFNQTQGEGKQQYAAVAALWPWLEQGHCCNLSVHSFRSVDGSGMIWEWMGLVADKQTMKAHNIDSEEGPNETDLTLLKDNKTLLTIFRIDGGDGYPNQRRVPYGSSTSVDGGKTWTFNGQLPAGVGAVDPHVVRVDPSGALLLSGGRPGLKVWFNAAGDGAVDGWVEFDVPSLHNNALRNPTINQNHLSPKSYAFCDAFVNAPTCVTSWSQSTCYTSINPLYRVTPTNEDNANVALLCYERQGLDVYHDKIPKECALAFSSVFCMRLKVVV